MTVLIRGDLPVKSSVRHAAQALVLGFGFYFHRTGDVRIRVAPKAATLLRQRVRALTGRSWRIAMPERVALLNRFVNRWCAYFALAEAPSTFKAPTNGCVEGSVRSGGRNGSNRIPGSAVCWRRGFPGSRPLSGATAAPDTGVWRVRLVRWCARGRLDIALYPIWYAGMKGLTP